MIGQGRFGLDCHFCAAPARSLEDQYIKPSSPEELLSIRKEREKYYSDSIHGASVSIYAGSVAYPFGGLDQGPFVSTVFGRASSCSFQTLHHVISQMAYFMIMIEAILEDCHNLKNVSDDALINVFKSNVSVVLEKSMNLVLETQ